MNVLVLCEESQAVCLAFRARGHNAFSCDLLPCSGGHPDYHLQMDAFEALRMRKWDLVIMHCPCTYTALCGNRWYWNSPLRQDGIAFTSALYLFALSVCDKVVLEQPKTIMQKYIGKRSQVIQPYEFGHGETKETWLWVDGLPLLVPTNVVDGREHRIWLMPPGPERSKLRSKTYPGIAAAMADQWG
jgi:hypothetical protein